jgi:hypothetical protein
LSDAILAVSLCGAAKRVDVTVFDLRKVVLGLRVGEANTALASVGPWMYGTP